MQCIPFDERFSDHVTQWMRENADMYRHDIDRMEEQMPFVYEKWLNTPADWLSGVAPGAYFTQFTDAALLVSWMVQYIHQKLSPPDPLLNRITALGLCAEDALFSLLTDETAPRESVPLSVSLLTEIGSVRPMRLYVDWIAEGGEGDERVDHAAQALTAMGPDVVPLILQKVGGATRAGREAFLDVLCNYPGDPAIFALAVSLFEGDPSRRALYASLLGKLGDSGAVAVLSESLRDPSLPYLDFIEIRNAIESLGGEVTDDREFAGDPAYDALRGISD